MSRSRIVRASWLGSVPYRRAWKLQEQLVASLGAGAADDVVLLLEHPHVFTMGKAAVSEHLLWSDAERSRRGVEVVWSDRGGEATYHGPGQLVAYPVLDLSRFGLTIPAYIELLERSLITYLETLGVHSEAGEAGLTGVWSAGEKVAAIGIKLNRSVVSHGIALNLTTDMSYFDGIIPCGHADKSPTSVEKLTGRPIPVGAAARDYVVCLADALGAEVRWVAPESLAEGSGLEGDLTRTAGPSSTSA